MQTAARRTLLSIALLGALVALTHGAAVAAPTPTAAATACPSTTVEIAVPGASAPLLEVAPAEPGAAASGCTVCRYNGQSCWCDPCPSVCETCPKGGIGGTCFFGTCQTACAV